MQKASNAKALTCSAAGCWPHVMTPVDCEVEVRFLGSKGEFRLLFQMDITII